jgi:hypothetical protein
MRPLIVQCFGGPAADFVRKPHAFDFPRHGSTDFELAMQFAACALYEYPKFDEPVDPDVAIDLGIDRATLRPILSSAFNEAKELVASHRAAVTAVAKMLRQKYKLTGDEVAEIMRHCESG